MVVISANTTEDDRREWEKTGFPVIPEPIDNNQELVDQVRNQFDSESSPASPCKKCIKELHLSGHGCGEAGVNWGGLRNFHADTLSDDLAKELNNMLCDDGVVRIWSCNTPRGDEGARQRLADKLDCSVSGIHGKCASGINGGDHSGSQVRWAHPME
jgi:hypothetical protein